MYSNEKLRIQGRQTYISFTIRLCGFLLIDSATMTPPRLNHHIKVIGPVVLLKIGYFYFLPSKQIVGLKYY